MTDHEEECLVAPIQTMYTSVDRDRIRAAARHKHLAPSVLQRVVMLDWLAAQEVKALQRRGVRQRSHIESLG